MDVNKERCKHYSWQVSHPTGTGLCDKNINVRDITGGEDFGWLVRTPCFNTHDTECVCTHFELKLAEEIAEDEAEWQKAIERMMLVQPLVSRVKEEHKGESWQGTEVCPVCDGVLRLSHAGINGHVWGQCETENCLKWME